MPQCLRLESSHSFLLITSLLDKAVVVSTESPSRGASVHRSILKPDPSVTKANWARKRALFQAVSLSSAQQNRTHSHNNYPTNRTNRLNKAPPPPLTPCESHNTTPTHHPTESHPFPFLEGGRRVSRKTEGHHEDIWKQMATTTTPAPPPPTTSFHPPHAYLAFTWQTRFATAHTYFSFPVRIGSGIILFTTSRVSLNFLPPPCQQRCFDRWYLI